MGGHPLNNLIKTFSGDKHKRTHFQSRPAEAQKDKIDLVLREEEAEQLLQITITQKRQNHETQKGQSKGK
jgi:hypothetical protein